MAITPCLGCSTECFLLVLVVTGLSILSPVWCELQINISSIPPSNKLSIGAAIFLTCTTWQTYELANNPYKRPRMIEWLDPQNNRIEPKCQQKGTPPAMTVMNCSLEVDALTDGKLGNYTCKACNIYDYCSTKRFQVDRQQGAPQINISSTPPSNKLSIGAALYLTCTAWQTNELAKDPKTRPHIIEWFDPHNKSIGSQCRAESKPTRLMKCLLEVGTLADRNFGNYTCRATNGYNYYNTKIFQVDQQQDTRHLEFVNVPVNQTAFLGSTVTFDCTATGFPKPTITWERVNNDSGSVQYNIPAKILAGDGNSIFSQLVIKEVKSKDYGIYHCVAKNSVGEKISIAILGSTGPSTTNKKKNVEIVAIYVAFSVAVMFLGAVSVFLQFFRRRCPRNQVV